MTLSQELKWRGSIKDHTFKNISWLDSPRSFYLGVDCSADSLQVGNLALLVLAKRLIDRGWNFYLVVGGATSLIGDPGGKKEERQLKNRQEITNNATAIKKQVSTIFGKNKFKLVDNYEWLKDVRYLDFLRDIGKNFAMSELLQRDFITERLGNGSNGISYAEFSYSLLQGYDYWHLYKTNHVELQIGGSDQWGNMLSGVPLIKKKEGEEVHAMSVPLVINKTTGIKFGKSEGGAIWLDSKKTSVSQFYQFWINVDDIGLEDYFKYYTFLSKEEINKILTNHQSNPALRIGQNQLAKEVTTIVHGQTKARFADLVSQYLIGKTDIASANNKVMVEIRRNIASIQSKAGGSIAEALILTGLAQSKTEAARLIKDNAIAINGHKIDRREFQVSDFNNGRLMLKKGKAFKDSVLVEL